MAYNLSNDTIAAIATAPGGALAIIRISGSNAVQTAEKVWFTNGKSLTETPRLMRLGHLLSRDGETCLAVYMKAPHSYTGEDVVELQCHGGSFAPERLIRAVIENGARMAEPGEFTRRAFINGKMDLTQAEAVLDLIQAQTANSVHLAERQLSGHIGSEIRSAAAPLLDLLTEIESRMDFPEEELDWRTQDELLALIAPVSAALRKLLASSAAGAILRNGVRLVIAGVPNAGKSSLLNRILGYSRAIVTDIPGTTRDTIEECAVIRGIRFHVSDTAGLRNHTSDKIEAVGIARTKDVLQTAEVIIWLLDPQNDITHQTEEMENTVRDLKATVIPCWNKSDLNLPLPQIPNRTCCAISAQTGTGLEELYDRLEKIIRRNLGERESDIAVSARHAALLQSAEEQLTLAVTEIGNENWELAAVNTREAIRCLGTITGENATPDVLDEIFSRFCIGK